MARIRMAALAAALMIGASSVAVAQEQPRPEQRVEKAEEPPKPVTNAQGQRTGTLINVVA